MNNFKVVDISKFKIIDKTTGKIILEGYGECDTKVNHDNKTIQVDIKVNNGRNENEKI